MTSPIKRLSPEEQAANVVIADYPRGLAISRKDVADMLRYWKERAMAAEAPLDRRTALLRRIAENTGLTVYRALILTELEQQP